MNGSGESLPAVIKRADVPALTHVDFGNAQQFIGEVRDFRRHDALRHFLPTEGRTSLSWVHLNTGETHETHRHPTASMVVVCEGEGELTGSINQQVTTGDIIIIPPEALHGFAGRGNSGFWGISVQFEGSGLFEDAANPRIKIEYSQEKLEPLKAAQQAHIEYFGQNELIKLVGTEAIRHDKNLQSNLLDVLQIWSDHFQKLIRIRSASARNPAFSALADDHLQDEFGHNHVLADMRGNRPINIRDAPLESTAAWFSERMAKGTDVEATIIMHLVIEEAGDIFHKAAAEIFRGSQHFEHHSKHDEDHALMGWQILEKYSTQPVEQMATVLNQGWAMMNQLCDRMAHLTVSRPASLQGTGLQRDQATPAACIEIIRLMV